MAKVGAQRAGDLTGRSKSTIQRAMKSGKLSFEVDANGRRVIDVSELERAFGLLPQEEEQRESRAAQVEIEKATHIMEMERLKIRIRFLEDQLDLSRDQIQDIRDQRDQWQKQAQQTLITSQYSQKQAEELKEEIKERERRGRLRRQQMEQRARAVRAAAKQAEAEQSEAAGQGFSLFRFWKKRRTPQQQAGAEVSAVSATGEAGDDLFRPHEMQERVSG